MQLHGPPSFAAWRRHRPPTRRVRTARAIGSAAETREESWLGFKPLEHPHDLNDWDARAEQETGPPDRSISRVRASPPISPVDQATG